MNRQTISSLVFQLPSVNDFLLFKYIVSLKSVISPQIVACTCVDTPELINMIWLFNSLY